jgi:hypothetical protein
MPLHSVIAHQENFEVRRDERTLEHHDEHSNHRPITILPVEQPFPPAQFSSEPPRLTIGGISTLSATDCFLD